MKNKVKLHSFSRFFAFLFLSFFLQGQLTAQCDQVGTVLSKVDDCGIQVLDLNSGKMYFAVQGQTDLSVGETISFSTEASTISPSNCPSGLGEIVKLTCTSDQLPCKAEFAAYEDESNSHLYHFSANVFDPEKQICTWDFGFGASSTGVATQVEFPAEGTYTVKLTVSDNFCTKEEVQEIKVSDVSQHNCGFNVQVTAAGLSLLGQLDPLTNGQSTLTSVEWYNNKSNHVFSNEEKFNFPLPDYGDYNVCVSYSTVLADGSTCVADDCFYLNIQEPGCFNDHLENSDVLCPTTIAPVCGCDGNTYNNECEALSSGVTKWWVGACNTQGSNCTSDFEVNILSGDLDMGYEIEFINTSSGNYFHSSFDFGDGSPIHEGTQWTTLTHHYDAGGLFLAQMSVWKNEDAVSVASSVVATDAASIAHEIAPMSMGYVLPGDTDGDGKANAHDLLNIGVGYYQEGTPRPNATLDWAPQLSPNWVHHTAPGVNHKHLDCDGNGFVNEFDPIAINQHYQAIDTFTNSTTPGAAEVFLNFPSDTITLTGNSSTVTISADLIVGKPTKPVFGLYGLSLAMSYPDYVNNNTIGYYAGEDFFGESNLTLWMQRNTKSKQQLDMSFVRKTGQSISGYGRMAKVDFQSDFIIIVDVILREDAKLIPFVVDIKSIKGIDENGNKVDLNATSNVDTVWIKLPNTTSVFETEAINSINITPNPVQDIATLSLPSTISEAQAEFYNQHGQLVKTQQVRNEDQNLDVAELPTGIYQIKVISNEGLFRAKLFKQ